MAKVLIVDDEPGYREKLSRCLSGPDVAVMTAGSGREAIDLGVRFRADVVVTDWMLQNHIHGLHVSQTLRMVNPATQTILITGFPSRDLRTEAEETHVFSFIEKPFEPDQLQRSVREAINTREPQQEPIPVAVLEVDAAGRIAYANLDAATLLGETEVWRQMTSLDDLFDPGKLPSLSVAEKRWVTVSALVGPPEIWHVRTKELPDGGWLLVLLAHDRQHYMNHAAVRMLLDITESPYARWPLEGRVLILDREQAVRNTVVTEMERRGAICHSAESFAVGLSSFQRDEDIQLVIVDFDMRDGDVHGFVQGLRAIRPDVTIVGTSSGAAREECAASGITRHLQKPWTVSGLVDLLLHRFGTCVDCGIPIPLRRPKPGDEASSWECCACGGRYFAVLDQTSRPDVISNVRPATRG